MAEMRNVKRQPITVKRDCSMGVIEFKRLTWTDHIARITDICRDGVGVESGTRVEPGFVWFRDRVWGHRGGLLLWSRPEGARYRAGIKFLPLSSDDERSIQDQVVQSTAHKPLRDSEKIIAALVESIKKAGP